MKIKNKKVIQTLLGALSLVSVCAAKSHAALIGIPTTPPNTTPGQYVSGWYTNCSCIEVGPDGMFVGYVTIPTPIVPNIEDATCSLLTYPAYFSCMQVGGRSWTRTWESPVIVSSFFTDSGTSSSGN